MLRKLARVLLNVLTALSLVLLPASAAMWVRSHFADDWLWWTDCRTAVAATTADGSFRCFLVRSDSPEVFYDVAGVVGHRTEKPSFDKLHDQYFVRDVQLSLAGFAVTAGHWPFSTRCFAVSAPLAPMALFSSALPARLFFRWYARRKWARIGLCRTCGYDLRATPSRCPECGTEPAR